MRAEGPVILKLGGSVITEKHVPLRPRPDVIARLAREIASSGVRELIIVHGGGSYGHPLAERYGIQEGFKDPRQLRGLAETHLAMEELNKLVVEALLREGLPAVPLPPVSCFVTKRGRVTRAFLEPLRSLLALGAMPVLYGDVVLDEELGFTILSGDHIVAHLALELGASRVVLCLDVPGVFTRDPSEHPDARLIERLRPEDIALVEAGSPRAPDVTGGMRRKLEEMARVAEAGIPVLFIAPEPPGNLARALRGERARGTLLSASTC